MRVNVLGVLDTIIDTIAERMAKAMVENMEEAAQNRLARELAEMSDEELGKRGISREKLTQGSNAYPWRANQSETHSDSAIEELDDYLMQLTQVNPEFVSGRPKKAYIMA